MCGCDEGMCGEIGCDEPCEASDDLCWYCAEGEHL